MKLVKLCVLVLVVWAAVGVSGQAADLGETAFLQGRFEEAAAHWEKVLSNPSPGVTATDMIEVTVRLASAYQELGKLQMARHILTEPALCQKIEDLKDHDSQSEAKAKILGQLSEIYPALSAMAKRDESAYKDEKGSIVPDCLLSVGGDSVRQELEGLCNKDNNGDTQKTDDKAIDYAYRALSVVPFANAWLKASLFNKLGNIFATRKDYCHALVAYRKSADLASQSGDNELFVKARLNSIQVRLDCRGKENCPSDSGSEKPCTLLSFVDKLPDSHDKVFALISLANFEKELGSSGKSCQQQDKMSFREEVLTKAEELAEKLHDKNALGYARLYLAELKAEECSQPTMDSDCYSKVITSLDETLKYHAQSYPLLQKFSTTGTEQFWIRHADSFVSSRFNWPLSPNVTPEQREKCKDWCKQYSSPCVQDKLPAECKDVCRSGPALFLRDYHPELSFRLEWQRGKVYKSQYDTEKQRDAETQGKIQKNVAPNEQARLQMAFEAKAKEQLQKAISAYDNAANYLQMVRRDYGGISKKFGVESENFYLDRADLLIQAAKVATEEVGKQNLLKSAIDSIESRQEAGLRNYFQDECVTEKFQQQEEKAVPGNTVLFYPVVFDDRIELILKFSDSIKIANSPSMVTTQELETKVKSFRDNIGNYNGGKKNYIADADYFYQTLIAPIANELKSVDTLLIVPNGALLSLPFSALYNQKTERYLVEDYASAVIPNWKLAIPSKGKIGVDSVQALLNGLAIKSLARQEFEPLVGATEEVKKVREIFKSGETLADKSFTFDNLKDRLQNASYLIIHFATHGKFEKEVNETFLLAYDRVLTLDFLEEIIKQKFSTSTFEEENPIEILVLSACESALGGELGLAGMGVKAGANSAVATLWLVAEDSTKDFVVRFYKEWAENKKSKAKALQQTQLFFLKDQSSAYTHPYFWAPFLLVGSW